MLSQRRIRGAAIKCDQILCRRRFPLSRPEQRALTQPDWLPIVARALNEPRRAARSLLAHSLKDCFLQFVARKSRINAAEISVLTLWSVVAIRQREDGVRTNALVLLSVLDYPVQRSECAWISALTKPEHSRRSSSRSAGTREIDQCGNSGSVLERAERRHRRS